MSIERTKQRLGNQNSKESVNTNTYLSINLEGKERLLPNNNINHVLNVAEQFNKERQECSLYKILGTINSTVSNCLFNLSDSSNADSYTYAAFNTLPFLSRSYPQDLDLNDDEDLTYSKSIDYYLKEKDGWFGYYDPIISGNSLCNFFDMEPKRQRFSFLLDYDPYKSTDVLDSVKNWELTITYPSLSYSGHPMISDNGIGGLLLVDVKRINISNRFMNAFAVPCKHNLISGDIVDISGVNGLADGQYTVYSIGLQNGDLKLYYFVIDTPNIVSITINSRFSKIVDEQKVSYYFRIFSKIKTKSSQMIETDDYETYQAGFSENFYNDPIIQFVFNEEIDVSGLKDNLGRPLSEIYLSMFKTSSNNLFTEVKSGIEVPYIQNLNNSDVLPYLRDIPAIQKIHNGGNLPYISHNPIETFQTIGAPNSFIGDLVEYNNTTLLETVLADMQHRFNTFNRQQVNTIQEYISTTTDIGDIAQRRTLNLGPRQEGYYYKPHHLIKIREFSNYIEEADSALDEIPSYATLKEDGTYMWRDLLSIGFNDGDIETLDYPFLNKSHYRYQNYCFNMKRQDPYAQWGLLYTDFPSDATGDRITDRFTVKSSDDVC
jgi:hypothetical protein